MNRKLKIVTALMAVLAMSAVMASAAQASFTANSYPAVVTGTSTNDVFHAFGSTVTCKSHFSGELKEKSNTLTITPKFEGCVAFGLPATVNMTSCDFLFHKPDHVAGTVDVICNTHGDAIDINVYSSTPHGTPICHVKVPGATAGSGGVNSGKSGYTLTNVHPNVNISGKIGGLTATQVRTSIFCPSGTHTNTAEYTIQGGGITISSVGKTIDVT